MKLARLSAISAVIMAISATHASEEFIDDSTLNIHLKNYYKHDKVKDKNDGNGNADSDSKNQWSQAIKIDFSSGYYKNLVSIDLGIYHALKLSSDIGSMNGLLQHSFNPEKRPDGYGKTTYAIKMNLMDYGMAKYGRMLIDTPLLSNSDTRSLPSLTEGFYADGSFNALSLYGLAAMKKNEEDQSGFSKYGILNGDEKRVYIVGGNYDFGHGISTNLSYGKQSDYAQRYFADINYKTFAHDVGLDFGFQYAHNANQGDSKVDAGDNKQHTWGAKAAAHIGAATIGLNYTAVEKTDMGDYGFEWSTVDASPSSDTAEDSTGYFGYNASQYSNFNKNGQKAWGFNASYNFDGLINGLNLHGAYVKGKVDPSNGHSWNEMEYNVGISYYLPMVEGLSAHFLYAHNSQEDQGVDDQGNTANEINKDTRVMVQYDIAVF